MPTLVYGAPNMEKTTPDYATISELKERLGIPDADTDLDDRLTLALVTAEIKVENHLGRSFPDVGYFQTRGVWKAVSGTADEEGEVSSSLATLVELSRTDYEGNDYADLQDVKTIEIGALVFTVTSFTESSTLWVFTGTVASGSFPAADTLAEVFIPALAPPTGVIATVPEVVHKKVLNLAQLEFKKDDAPTGIAGADDFIGALDINDAVRSELNDRTLLGLKVSWGVG